MICHVILGGYFKMADVNRVPPCIPQKGNCFYIYVLLLYLLYPAASDCPEDKYLNRYIVNEVAAACAYHPNVWRDLGIELLGQDGRAGLDVIKANHSDDVTKCCSAMLTLWRQRQTNASWSQLIEAMKQLKLIRVATEVEKLLKSSTEQEHKIADTMQDLKINATQQQDLQTAKQASLQEESSIGMPYVITAPLQRPEGLHAPCNIVSHKLQTNSYMIYHTA